MTTDNNADIIDIRDVIKEVEELDEQLEALKGKRSKEANESRLELLESLKPLTKLLGELKGYGGDEKWNGDWYPITLIRDTHFEDYAREFAEEIGAINSDAKWPNNCIDWGKAANELKQDYSTVEFDDVTYWYR